MSGLVHCVKCLKVMRPDEDHHCKEGKMDEYKSVLSTSWCTECYPDKQWAEFTYRGYSLCLKHFDEEWTMQQPQTLKVTGPTGHKP